MRPLTFLCLVLTLLFALFVLGVMIALCLPVPPGDLLAAVSSAETFFALRLSLICAVCATLVALLWGVPAGYLLARKRFRGKLVLDTLLDIPMIIPPLVVGVGILFLLSRSGLGGMMGGWGIQVLFTPYGAFAAQTFIVLPIIIRTSRVAFEGVHPGYEAAALTLGLAPVRVFFKITLPLARPGILSGAILAMARAMGEFGATLMVAGATRMKTETLPIAVYLNISSGELGIALSCAWILIVTSVLILVLLKTFAKSAPRN